MSRKFAIAARPVSVSLATNECIMAQSVTTYRLIGTVYGASAQMRGGLGYTTIMTTTISSWTGGADGVA